MFDGSSSLPFPPCVGPPSASTFKAPPGAVVTVSRLHSIFVVHPLEIAATGIKLPHQHHSVLGLLQFERSLINVTSGSELKQGGRKTSESLM